MKRQPSGIRFVPISEIKIGPRIRKNPGNVEGLAGSMHELGLLQPILVTQNKVLVAGLRRLTAAKRLGWKKIATLIVNLEK